MSKWQQIRHLKALKVFYSYLTITLTNTLFHPKIIRRIRNLHETAILVKANPSEVTRMSMLRAAGTREKRLLALSCPSACLPALNNSAATGRIFKKHDI